MMNLNGEQFLLSKIKFRRVFDKSVVYIYSLRQTIILNATSTIVYLLLIDCDQNKSSVYTTDIVRHLCDTYDLDPSFVPHITRDVNKILESFEKGGIITRAE